MPTLEPTREAGLARLAAFVPRMGRRYASERAHDRGRGRNNVSNLSPWIRRRLVLESEAAAAALDAHGARTAEKFVQEVVWRTYWKGWLQQRPQVWDRYVQALADDHERLGKYRDLGARYEAAVAGDTGIEPFDDWAVELRETGILHNHARMWFASIWIFTLDLPWRLGADLFYRHLLDADPASNTLSWRWVAGRHTAGKTYLATPENIAKYTDGRYRVPMGVLAEHAPAPEVVPAERQPLPTLDPPRDEVSVLLVTEEDCRPETLVLPKVERAVLVPTAAQRSSLGVSDEVVAFERGALEDTGRRLRAAGMSVAFVEPDELARTLARSGAHQIVGAELPIGSVRDALRATLAASGLPFRSVRRPWDEKFWPHATAGFFKLRKAIPKVVEELRREGELATPAGFEPAT